MPCADDILSGERVVHSPSNTVSNSIELNFSFAWVWISTHAIRDLGYINGQIKPKWQRTKSAEDEVDVFFAAVFFFPSSPHSVDVLIMTLWLFY